MAQKLKLLLLDENLECLRTKNRSTPKNDYQEIISSISNLISDVTSNLDDFSLGICTPGVISKQTGVMKNSNTQCLIGKSIQR